KGQPLVRFEPLQHIAHVRGVQRLHEAREFVGLMSMQIAPHPLEPDRTDTVFRIAGRVDFQPGVPARLSLEFAAHREPFSCPGGFRGEASCSQSDANAPDWNEKFSRWPEAVSRRER